MRGMRGKNYVYGRRCGGQGTADGGMAEKYGCSRCRAGGREKEPRWPR